jgi:tetratricopeptide (TPR) repeat protein
MEIRLRMQCEMSLLKVRLGLLRRATAVVVLSCAAEGWHLLPAAAGPLRNDPDTSQKEDSNPVMNAGYGVALLGMLLFIIAALRIRKEYRMLRQGEYGWNADYRPDLLGSGDTVQTGLDPASIARRKGKRFYGIVTLPRALFIFLTIALFVTGTLFGTQFLNTAICVQNGRVALIRRNYEGAIEQYNKALKYDWGNSQLHTLLADVYLRQMRIRNAIPHLMISTKAEHPDPRAWVMLGDCLQIDHRLEEAEEAYSEAIALRPSEDDTYMKLSMCLEKLNRQEDAVRELRKAIRIDQTNVRAQASLGRLLMQLGFVDEGIDHLRATSALVPDDVNARHALASAYVTAGRFADAAEQFRAALAIQPEYARDYYNLGFVLQKLHDLNGAREAYRIYVAMTTHKYDPADVVMKKQAQALITKSGKPSIDSITGPHGVTLPEMISVKRALDNMKELEPVN